jgi:hypothetical protein
MMSREEPISSEVLLVEPGTMRAELFQTIVMGHPEMCRGHQPGKRVGVCKPVGDDWEIVERCEV